MPTPDVRVRLSAEGVAEVVAALQRIRSESQRTAQATTSGFGGLNSALRTVRGTLAALGVAISVGTFSALVTGAAEAAESTLNLSQALGASVQHTQAISAAAKRAGTDLGSISGSIGRFAQESQKALRGDPEALGLFRAVGLTRQELEKFKGLDTVARLELTAQAFSKLRDGTAKTDLAIDLFGKKFKDLIPLVNELGARGLPKLAIQMSEATLQAADALGDELDDLKIEAQQLAIQFTAGLAPALIGMARSLKSVDRFQLSSIQAIGAAIGALLGTVVALIETTFLGVQGIFNLAIEEFFGLVRVGQALMTRGVGAAQQEWKDLTATQKRIAKATLKDIEGIWKTIFTPPAIPALTPGGTPGEDVGDRDEALQRRADLRRAQIDRELKAFQASQKLREEIERRSFDDGLTSLREYYDRRRAIVAAGVNAEIVALQKRRVLAERDPGLKNRAAEIEKIDSQIEQLVLGRAAQLEELNAREAEEYRRLANERLELDRKVFEARGDQHAAALLQIQDEIEKADLLLSKMGVSAEEAERTLSALRASLNAQAEFNLLSREASLSLTELDQDRAKIQDQMNAGLLAQAEGEARILALERDRVESLRALGEALARAAEESGDPERAAQAEDFLRHVEQIELALRRLEDVGAGLKATIVDQLGQSFVQTFGEGEVAAIRFGTIVKTMLIDLANAVRRFLTQLIFMKAAMAIFGGSPKAGVPGEAGDVSGPVLAAGGGYVTGPGTPGVDSINARIAPGEYIVRAAAVARPGVLRALDALNRGGVHLVAPHAFQPTRFAQGGLVGSAGGAGGPSQAWIRLGMQRGFFAELIRSPEGKQAILEVVEESPKAFGSLLGPR